MRWPSACPSAAAAALTALAAQKSPDALLILQLYTRHRNPELRKRATQGLAALVVVSDESEVAAKPTQSAKKPVKVTTKSGLTVPHEELAPKVVPQLIFALSDASAEVRQVAAEALNGKTRKVGGAGAHQAAAAQRLGAPWRRWV